MLDFILDYGTYSSFQSQLPYLKYLGVTLIRIMSLEPMHCSLSSSINIKCWRLFYAHFFISRPGKYCIPWCPTSQFWIDFRAPTSGASHSQPRHEGDSGR